MTFQRKAACGMNINEHINNDRLCYGKLYSISGFVKAGIETVFYETSVSRMNGLEIKADEQQGSN